MKTNETVKGLWVEKYRPQTVKDCILPSETHEVFMGSTLTGFDPAKSFEKTVRKPDEFLKNADGCRKTFASAVRYLSGVKTKNSEPTGRINKHCLLLQVN